MGNIKSIATGLYLAVAACLTLAAVPAQASLIQDFTFSGPDVSGGGTAEFDGMGGVTLDLSGSAWGHNFDVSSITGTGEVDLSTWTVTELDFSSSRFFSDDGLVEFLVDATQPLEFFIICDGLLFDGDCGGQPRNFNFALVSYTPRHDVPEPGALALLATGLAGLGIARRRRMKAITA